MGGAKVYKLIYFDCVGLGEGVRYLFHANNQHFEDYRVEFSEVDHETLKFRDGVEWDELKPKMPFGQIPVLKIGETQTLCQTKAIQRFLGKQFGMAGSNDYESAVIDMIADRIDDLHTSLDSVYLAKDVSEMKDAISKLTTRWETVFTSLERMLEQNKGGEGFFVGDKMTWVDTYFAATCLLTRKFAKLYNFDVPVNSCTHLLALVDRVESAPEIAAYISQRHDTFL